MRGTAACSICPTGVIAAGIGCTAWLQQLMVSVRVDTEKAAGVENMASDSSILHVCFGCFVDVHYCTSHPVVLTAALVKIHHVCVAVVESQVIKLISKVIADFANGEISQASSLFDTEITLQQYLDKSFYKTASLIAASCRSSAVFSNMGEMEKEAMYNYGKHLGLAFQASGVQACL